MRHTARYFPDLSRSTALAEDAKPVLLNGMKVVFDQKVGLYPVRIEDQESAPEATLRKANAQALRFVP